jgi:uncharacterized OB-fold protein
MIENSVDSFDEIDPEGPSEEDLDRLNNRTARCTECGEEIFDYTDVCPYCGAFQIEAERAKQERSPWLTIAIVVMAALILLFTVFGGRLF